MPVSASVEQLYEKYGPMVLRRCRKLLRDEARAVDAMHDVFVLMLRNDHLEVSADGGSSLLFRLATNVCLNQLRSVRRKPEDANDELVLSIAQELDVESRAQARSFLTRLFADEPETTATIAVLHYLDGMTWDEVATEVNMSVSGVRKRARGITERVKSLQERNP
jgi:RNA polymerase sigma-70 factor, ECF subfamily